MPFDCRCSESSSHHHLLQGARFARGHHWKAGLMRCGWGPGMGMRWGMGGPLGPCCSSPTPYSTAITSLRVSSLEWVGGAASRLPTGGQSLTLASRQGQGTLAVPNEGLQGVLRDPVLFVERLRLLGGLVRR